jgi:hypothetical protein
VWICHKTRRSASFTQSFALFVDGQSSLTTMVGTPSSRIIRTGWQMACFGHQMLKHLRFVHGSPSGNFGRNTVGTYGSVSHVMIHAASAPSTATRSGTKKRGRRLLMKMKIVTTMMMTAQATTMQMSKKQQLKLYRTFSRMMALLTILQSLF